ncbi:MAG: adenylyltransferase/cytidyltransferase family protein [Brachymonas sp.]|nr:adenylyltransferase/cytidyltransferase family protein [Brachymonas sp.]
MDHSKKTAAIKTANALDYAVVIGRFQPVHCGHVALLRAALHTAPKVVVVVGSVGVPRSPKNPFTLEERVQMLRAALPEDADRIHVAGVENHPDDTVWVSRVQAVVDGVVTTDGASAAAARVALVGHAKDASTYYLELFAHWQFVPFANVAGLDGTSIRNSYFTRNPDPDPLWLQPGVLPASTRDYLEQFRHTRHWLDVCRQREESLA